MNPQRTRTALAGAAASAAWLSFAGDGPPARVAVGAVLALLPAVTVAGHLRAAGHRPRVAGALAAAASTVTVLTVADLAPRLGTGGGPALVAVVLAVWTAALLRRPAARAPRSAPPVLPVPVPAPVPTLPGPAAAGEVAPVAGPGAVAQPEPHLPHAG
ncbi:hypothetical protein AB2L27_05025 [Kineococcus sp. LSe6-4]|uniref:Uncharacterized protein n=1 Tax=Kineococcus halophytocola TaxID=3234027 RepID=A0ABV4GXT3_9ACTN